MHHRGDSMSQRQLFWLHVKKSAGITTRSLLKPHYTEVDRANNSNTFIQALPEEYNDILNNYRVVLGAYQFKRCLYAKKYLYPKKWEQMFSFAFSREPTDRCVSMFYYLFWKDTGYMKNTARAFTRYIRSKKFIFSTSYAFDVFLDYAHQARCSDSIYYPLGNHFTTHTAPMWDDITDFTGNVLLDRVYRVENLIEGINSAFEECGIAKRLDSSVKKLNQNKRRKAYIPNQHQREKIREIYSRDFEIYENAWH
jgi:hypothetical protein